MKKIWHLNFRIFHSLVNFMVAMMIWFCGMIDRPNMIGLISSQDHNQDFSSLKFSDMRRVGLKPTQNLRSDLSQCRCQAVAHWVKSGRIRSYSGPHFPVFGLNTERYLVSLRTQSECGKIRTRITPNTDTFYAVVFTTLKSYVCILLMISPWSLQSLFCYTNLSISHKNKKLKPFTLYHGSSLFLKPRPVLLLGSRFLMSVKIMQTNPKIYV